MRRCISCGRIIKDDDIDTAGSGKNEELKYCSECLDENGKLKTYDEVSESLAKYLIRTQGLDEKAALNAAKAIASSQPEWNKKQGVYFEKDMKKRKNTIVSLFVILVLLLITTGIGLWYNQLGNEEVILFSNNENYEITRMVGDIEIHELDLPGGQYLQKQLFDSNPNILSFISPNLNSHDGWMKGYDIYGYDIENNLGKKLTNYTSLHKTSLSISNNLCAFAVKDTCNQYLNEAKIAVVKFNKNVCFSAHQTEIFPDIHSTSNLTRTIPSIEDRNIYWYVERNNEIKELILLDDYLIWREETDRLTNAKSRIILFNINTERELVVSDYVFGNLISVSNNNIIWYDNRDINLQNVIIYCYDINNEEEYIVSNEPYARYFDINNRYIIFSKAEVKNSNHKQAGLYVFDTTIREELQTEITKNKLQEPLDYSGNIKEDNSNDPIDPLVIMSKGSTPESTHVAWIEEISNREQLPWNMTGDLDSEFLPRLIGIQNVANIGKKPMRVVGENDKSESQTPIMITSEYIIWMSLNERTKTYKLWIGRVADGRDNGIIESILIDESQNFSYRGLIGNTDISDNYAIWSKRSSDKMSNICWASLSDIFPENTNTAGMEE